MGRPGRSWWALAGGLAAIGGVTVLLRGLLDAPNPTLPALGFVLIVFVVAASAPLAAALVTSVFAFLCFNYFFLPPVGTWTIADPQNWVALFTLLAVSVAVSHLASVARTRTAEALAARDETARLFDFSRDVLQVADDRASLTALARSLVARYRFDGVVIALKQAERWAQYASGTHPPALTDEAIAGAVGAAGRTLEFDARARSYRGHTATDAGGQEARLVPIRAGATPIGILAVTGGAVDSGPLDALAGLIAIAVARIELTRSRRDAEIARRSDALKSTLLSTLAHDLRTPLTAIGVAAANLQTGTIGDAERREQGQLIDDEVGRLQRLFQNILEMARIDTGGVPNHPAWVHPSEIVDAARTLVAPVLRDRDMRVVVDPDRPVHVDARLTATALAHILENAAKYSPAGTPIDVDAGTRAAGLMVSVRDYGPGLQAGEVTRVFDPFVRGGSATNRPAGTGMGLAIARGLLAAAGGRVWGESVAAGGTRFTIEVDAPQRQAADDQGDGGME